MFVLSKRNIILPSRIPGVAPVVLKKDGFADVPDWAADTAYFKALVEDGKLIVTGHSDKTTQDAADKKLKPRRGKSEDAPAEPAPED